VSPREREVPHSELVKGYEYEKGRYAVSATKKRPASVVPAPAVAKRKRA
jgi:hypothetical protein